MLRGLGKVGWVFFVALIAVLMAIVVPPFYQKHFRAPIAIQVSQTPKLFIEQTIRGVYLHKIELQVDIEVRRGGELRLKTVVFDTDIGRVESPKSGAWGGFGKGATISDVFISCKLEHPQRNEKVKGKLTVLTERGEKASLNFTARADG
ncbi:MAG: hypothetical protein ACE5JC_05690 [Candidatus Zixiibacteriota bacterium]